MSRSGTAGNRLENRVAIVTGGASGIGKATAVAFAQEGAKVVVSDMNQAKCDDVAAEIGSAGGTAIGFATNVTDRSACHTLINHAVATYGRLDILMNAAGVFRMGELADITEEDWDYVFDVNCKGTLWCAQAAAAQFIAQGHGGRIINIASQAGRRGEAHVDVYCASKSAVISLTQSLALALAKHNVNVNGIAPGIIETPMWGVVDSMFGKLEGLKSGEAKARAVSGIPFQRIGMPENVADMAVFLASDESSYITRQTFNVDGGNWPN